MEKNNGSDISEEIRKTGVDPEKAIVITKMVEEYTLQKIERISSIEVVKNNLERINDIIINQMIEGRHYGLQEGTSKKTLKLPGQDLLMMNFSMRPSYSAPIITDLGDEHRDYLSTCFIYKFIDLENSLLVGEGSGSCSTREKKYRQRWTPINYSPAADYWKLLKEKRFAEAKSMLPEGIESRKIGERWLFCKQTENPDLADVYNTVLKMSRIRAKREAIQTLFAIAGAFDFMDPEDDKDKSEPLPDISSMQPAHAEFQEPKAPPKKKEQEFKFDYLIPDLADPAWFKTTIDKCKSAEEIDSFMKQFETERKFFHDDIQTDIFEHAAKAYRVFKPKKQEIKK